HAAHEVATDVNGAGRRGATRTLGNDDEAHRTTLLVRELEMLFELQKRFGGPAAIPGQHIFVSHHSGSGPTETSCRATNDQSAIGSDGRQSGRAAWNFRSIECEGFGEIHCRESRRNRY